MAALAGSIVISGTATAAGWQDFSQDAKSAVRNAMFMKSEVVYESPNQVTDADSSPLLGKDIRLTSSEIPSNCLDTADDCQEELDKLRADTLSSINLDIHVTGLSLIHI